MSLLFVQTLTNVPLTTAVAIRMPSASTQSAATSVTVNRATTGTEPTALVRYTPIISRYVCSSILRSDTYHARSQPSDNGGHFFTNTNTNTIKTYKAPLYKTGQERYKSTVSGYMHEQKVQFSV